MIDKKDQISKFRHTFIFQMNMVESIARRTHFSTCCCVTRSNPSLLFVVIIDVSRIRLQELNMLHPDEGFRLWMTAEVHPKFPTVLLQTSLKVTYEVRTQGHIERGSSAIECPGSQSRESGLESAFAAFSELGHFRSIHDAPVQTTV